jgi:hypothetical protein
MSWNGSRRRLRKPFLWTFLFLLFCCFGSVRPAAADVGIGPITSTGPGQFAIADFDGDVRPDSASIQAGPNSSGTANYWIQLQLSVRGQQSIQLVAPAGGLRMEARDVNGDHSIDLVLATAWFRQPVAILLNDGHGNFSRLQPTVFPEAFSDSKINWDSPANQVIGVLGVPPQSHANLCSNAGGSLRRRASPGPILLTGVHFLGSPVLISHAGRAPPSEVSHS